MEYIVEPSRVQYAPTYVETVPFVPKGGVGYLAGSFPDGITTIDGVPTSAVVRVHLRKDGVGDGMLVATTASAADGTWRVDGLNPDFKYDVISRKAGYNDVIISNVSPAL